MLRIVTGCRVVTLLHAPSFDALFIIKLLGGELLERLSQNALTHECQSRFLIYCKMCQFNTQDKSKRTRAKNAERVDRKHKQLPVLFSQRDATQTLRSM